MTLRILYFLIFISLPISAQNTETKPWNALDKLKWVDFKGAVDPDVFAYALTSYKIEIIPESVQVDENDNIRNYQQLTVMANFYSQHSWHTIDDLSLLKHEQLHFDIAELFARKIRKRFIVLQKNKERKFSVYQKEYSLLWKALRKYQKLYDKETNHGVKLSKNEEWVLKINNELESLDGYKM